MCFASEEAFPEEGTRLLLAKIAKQLGASSYPYDWQGRVGQEAETEERQEATKVNCVLRHTRRKVFPAREQG